jgi:nitroreductase
MRRRRRAMAVFLAVFLFSLSVWAQTEAARQIPLPKPQTDGGKPLMQVLKDRRSTRAFADRKLSEQVLSNLLWSACGINRSDGKRTAPSAMNRQEVDVYVVLAEGAFLYDPKGNALKQVSSADLRAQAGTQDFVKDAPVNLIYVADTAKMRGGAEETKVLWYGVATGAITQNVYLYCASEGLVTVVRAFVDRGVLAKSLSLRPEQRIALAQTVGYPR